MTGARPAVVVVATTFPARPGDGTPEFVLTLARSLSTYDVTVVAPRMRGAAREEDIDGVRVVRVRYFLRRWEGLATEAIMPTLRAQPWRVAEVPFLLGGLTVRTVREVRRRRAVVVNAHWIVPGGLVAVVASLVARVPYVVTAHGADAFTLRGRLARRLKRAILRRAAAVLPVSSDIARALDLPPDAPVLRMGVDTRAARAQAGERRPQAGRLVCVGRLADKKGFDVAIDALADVPGAHLEIIGDGPDRARLAAQAEGRGVADRVTFRGLLPKQDVLQSFARAQAVVIPSRIGAGGDRDGTPVVLSEAMAVGAPVVASDLGGLGECITDGVDGLLVPPGDAGALAHALRRVVSGEVDLGSMGAAAADTARRTLDISTVGRAYERAFDRAAGRPVPIAPESASAP